MSARTSGHSPAQVFGEANEGLWRQLLGARPRIDADGLEVGDAGQSIERVGQGLAALAEGGAHQSGDQVQVFERA